MKHTFLHLSDLHYRPNWPEQTDLVCQKFFTDLKSQISSHQNPFLIFSGDFVLSGGDADFYKAFEAKFGTALADAGIPKSRRICVPGNHDVSRNALKEYSTFQKGSLAQMKDERS